MANYLARLREEAGHMIKKVKQYIESHSLLRSGDTVLLACSGGPDSLALLHILQSLRSTYGIELVAAHVDHMIRGAESAADAQFVADFCRQRDIRCYCTALDVPASAAGSGHSLEETARFLRYRYLREVAEEVGAAAIATGHHRDDQAETVLIHLLRGAGSDGLAGMLPAGNGIIRPLLAVTRSEIEAYCREHRLPARLDSTNGQTDYLRNSIRLELLPWLEERYNPAIKESLCRTAAIIGEEHAFVRAAAEQVWGETVQTESDMFVLDGQKFARLSCALQREVLRLTIEKKQGNLRGISFYHVEKMIEMILTGQVGACLPLPGCLWAKRTYTGLVIGALPQPAKPEIPAPVDIRLHVPGRTVATELGCIVHARLLQASTGEHSPQTAVFDADKLVLPLGIRTRLPGDRFVPLGMRGSKKLKDFFIDAKVERQQRDQVPIIYDAAGILWVCGFRQSERGKIDGNTRNLLQLTIEKQGEKDDTFDDG